MTKKDCLVEGPLIDGERNLLVAEVVADIINDKAILNKSETGFFFKIRDQNTYETKTLRYVKRACDAARESKKYFQKPLDTARINELTKGYLDDIRRDYIRSQTRERLEKFAKEFENLKKKYNVFLRTNSDDEYIEIEAVDSNTRDEYIVVS